MYRWQKWFRIHGDDHCGGKHFEALSKVPDTHRELIKAARTALETATVANKSAHDQTELHFLNLMKVSKDSATLSKA